MIWPSIPLLANMMATANKLKETGVAVPDAICYRGKVKRDGTFAAIESDGATKRFFSRNQELTISNDNFGFAKRFQDIPLPTWTGTVTVYGEWSGPGIQNKTIDSKFPERRFFVFLVEVDGKKVDASEIAIYWPALAWESVVIPVRETVTLCFDGASNDDAVSLINKAVTDIETVDPDALSWYGLTGMGEGYVFEACTGDTDCPPELKYFKAKVEGLRVKLSAAAASTKLDTYDPTSFVAAFVTDARCRQFFDKFPHDKKSTNSFINAVLADVMKESVEDRAVNSISEEGVAQPIKAAARTWYLRSF
jgi:hypothetical protein